VTSIEPYSLSGGGDFFLSRVENGLLSFHIIIDHVWVGGGRPTNLASSPFWKGMLSVKDIFLQATAKEIRNGRTTQFWRDNWCSTIPLEVLFSALFRTAHDCDGLVSSHWMDTGWNIKVPEIPITLMEELTGLLPSTISENSGDRDLFL